MSRINDLTNQKFGRLTVISRAPSLNGATRWYCKCECGSNTISHSSSLKSGKTKSCGCLSHEIFKSKITKHNMSNERIYSIWCGIKKRCFNKNYDHDDRYGGRGITICNEWLDFMEFYNWSMINGYNNNLTIDRIDNNGNYEPLNCRWIAKTQQIRNRSTTIYLNYNGEIRTLKEWREIYSVNYKPTWAKYKKGWDFEKIFNL